MKKNYLVAMLLLIFNFASAQIEQTNYRGAFAPSPTPMWTDSWTNYDPKNEPYVDAATVVNVTTDITASTTWTTGKTYKLNGLIYVRNNAILTIQPGVVIKGNFTNTGTALIITKGAKLNAIGTVSSPIVFTSGKTVAQGRQPGDWGGIVLLGKAGFNTNNGINNIEGITANVNTEYGGGPSPINNDDSGTLKYVRIEFGGYVFSPNNEINGLTMGSVGSGTTIDYVQVSYANDDAFEWFGGSVNCKHLVSYRNLDDDFDTDNGYKGVVQFVLGIRDPSIADNPSVSTSEGFESDNNSAGAVAASGYDNTAAIFTNITLIGPAVRATLSPTSPIASGHERALRLRRATQLKVYNSIFMDFKNNFLFVDGSLAVSNANGGTLKFKNNIMAGNVGAFTGGVNPASLNTWFSSNGNTVQASSAGILALPYSTTNTYLGLDYRPGTVAASGADFSDSSMTPYITTVVGSNPVPTNTIYCKGAVATALTATLTTTGVSLKWYTVATAGVASTTAPTPATSTVGVKNYYVSQVNSSAVESDRVLLTVTTNALPTEVVGAIVGTGPVGSTSAVAVGNYVGTTSEFVYTIPAFVDTTLTYLWSVPLGVNIVSGQGTNSLTVNFANVAFGAGSVGSIQVQAVNTSGCKTLAKSLALTKVLPVAPASIKLFNNNAGYATPLTAITTYAKYMGSTTELTLTAAPVVGVSLYQWELPSGVNVVTGGVSPVTTTVTYTAEPFFSPASTPSAVGTKYWVITYNAYTFNVNGDPTTVTISTASQKIWGNAAYGGISSAPYLQYGTVVTSNKNSILVNFNGVTNSSTTALYLGVRSKNGVGYSITSNATNADVTANNNIPGLYTTTYTETTTTPIAPSTNGTSTYAANGTTPKTAKLQKFTAALPAAPTALKLTNDAISTITAVTVVSKYIGTTTPLTLTAVASVTASSYTWELPSGVTQLSGGNSNVITVDFAGVPAGTTSLYLGAKAVNGIGSSITTTNGSLTPATSSTAKLLKVTATVPAAVATVAGQIGGVCGGNTYSYTMVASLLANSYVITAPVGSIVTSASNTSNNSNTLATSDLTFSVTYPSNFATMTVKTIVIASVNGVGTSLANKSITIATAMPAIGIATGSNGITTFNRDTPQTFTVPAVLGATTYTWTPINGAVIVSGQGTNSVVVDFALVPLAATSNILKVAATNSCGVSTAVKSLTLSSTSSARLVQKPSVEEVSFSNSNVYPNPAANEFNIDIDASKVGNVQMTIYTLTGILVTNTRTIMLEEGKNTINENVTNLSSGIYIVKLIDSSNKEVMVKKLIKK